MSYFDDALELLGSANAQLLMIEREHQESLAASSIKPELRVSIKHFLDDLKSALDYSAHGLFDKYGSSSRSNPRIFFPYAAAAHDLEDFRRSNRVNICIPGLAETRPDIIEAIEGMQHWNAHYWWVPPFMDLCGENKHERLTPQVKITREVKTTNFGSDTRIIFEQGSGSLILGPTGSLDINGHIILGPREFNFNNPPPGATESSTWKGLCFSSNGQRVLHLLPAVFHGVSKIVDQLSCM